MSKGRFALGAVFGAVAGFVTGVILAPKSGKKTRAELSKVASKAGQEVRRKADKVINKVKKVSEAGPESASKIVPQKKVKSPTKPSTKSSAKKQSSSK